MSNSITKPINTVNIDVAKDMLYRLVRSTVAGDAKSHLNVCLHSSPGLGKSSIVAQIASDLGVNLIDLRLAAMEASDVLGIPFTVSGEMRFSTPEWWPDGSVPTILFLDELKSAPPAVQTAAYRLILDRTIQNGKKLPDNCFIIAAGNMKEDKTGARDLLPAAANRFAMHLLIDKKGAAEPFLNYAVSKGLHRSVIGYLSWRQESIYGEIGDEAAFPTPRSWEAVSNLLNTELGDALNTHQGRTDGVSMSIVNIAVAGAVGSQEALSFAGYLENEGRLPEWKRIRSGDTSYDYQIPRGDICLEYAVGVGVAFEIIDALGNDKKDEVDRMSELVSQLGTDMKIVMFKTLKRDPKLGIKVLSIPSMKAHFEEVRPYIIHR